jgi:hypothetical protein
MARRLWATLVDTASADRTVRDSSDACFAICGILGAMLAWGIWCHNEHSYPLLLFVVVYGVIGWRVRRGSAPAVEFGLYFFLLAVGYVMDTPSLTQASVLRVWLPFIAFYLGIGLLNGVRAVSYLETVGRDDWRWGDEPGSTGVPVWKGPKPTLPTMAESGD